MAVIERPHREALSSVLDVYRDAMRPFIVRRLKRVRGMKVEDAIRNCLHDTQSNRFDESLRAGRSVEDSIDISEFPQIVGSYWRETFQSAFKPGSDMRDALRRIAEARNRVAHPESQDIELEYVADRATDIAGVLLEINESTRSEAVEDILEGIQPFRTPAHKFQQGDRDVYAFTLDLRSLDKLLPERLDDAVVRDANRPLTPKHATDIQKYLEEREDWLLGTLQLGISQDSVGFQPYPGTNDSLGELHISSAGFASMKIFDGQHRRRAIKNALSALSRNVQNASRLSALHETSLPIMLYVEDRIEKLRQMFADAAQTRAIERNTVTRFDLRDAFNVAALWTAEESDLFSGRVEMESASVSRSNNNIIAINQLAMTLKTMEVGYKGRVSKDRNGAYMLDIDALNERCLMWADDFMPASREEYNALMAGDIDNSDIPDERTKTMAYNATFIRILAACYHEWIEDEDNWELLADFLRTASLQPGAISDTLLIDAGAVAPGGTSPTAQRETVSRAIEYIIRQAKESGIC